MNKYKAWDKIDKKMRKVREIGFDQYGGIMYVVLVVPYPVGDGDVDFDFIKREPEEVDLLQYTGINATRGEEIYQGGIIKKDYYNGYCYLRIREYNSRLVAEFLPNLPYSYVIGLNEADEFDYYELYTLENYHLTVIGNTKEDRELLEGNIGVKKFIDKVLDNN